MGMDSMSLWSPSTHQAHHFETIFECWFLYKYCCLFIYIYMWLSHHSLTSLFYHIISSEWKKTVHWLAKNILSTDCRLNHPPITNHVTWMLQVSWNFDGMNIKECFLSHWNYYGCQPSNISIPVARPANLTVCYWKWPIYSWFTQL